MVLLPSRSFSELIGLIGFPENPGVASKTV
jgi:hypothetical protein